MFIYYFIKKKIDTEEYELSIVSINNNIKFKLKDIIQNDNFINYIKNNNNNNIKNIMT